MREVDRIAVEDFGLGILQMMENAGRNLALTAIEMLDGRKKIAIFAGSGGNGGGGLCAARHLHNRGFAINLFLSKPPEDLKGAAAHQFNILKSSGVNALNPQKAVDFIEGSDLIIDALIGYSLKGSPRGQIQTYIDQINLSGKPVLSLDIPSGIDSSDGHTPGKFIQASQTMTLALPKPGLANPAAGELLLADIGIPLQVYHPLDIRFEPFFGGKYRIKINREQ